MRKWLWLLTLLIVPALHGQVSNPGVIYVTTAPTGACGPYPPVRVVISTGVPYTCNNGTWGAAGGSGAPTGPAGGFLTGTYPNPGGLTATAAGQQLTATAAGTTYAAQSKIALDPRDYGADFNGGSVADATTTSASNVITCPNSDCNFPSTIAGYIIFATAGDGSHCLDNASIKFGGNFQTTVATYTNANSITVTGTADTTGTATVCLAWFPIDSTTALNAWWAAGGCTGSYMMPAGKTLFSAPIMQNLSGCGGAVNSGLAYPGQNVAGGGVGSTYLMPAPIFTYTGLSGNNNTNCAVGNLNVENYRDFAVFGLGERAQATQANTCLFMMGTAARGQNIDTVGWDARGGGTTLDGVRVIGATDTWMVGGSNYFGAVEMEFTNTLITVLSSFTSGNAASVNGVCGVQIDSGASVTMIDNGFAECLEVNGGTLNSTGGNFVNVAGDGSDIYVGNGARLNLLGNDLITPVGTSDGINVFAGTAIVSALNSKIAGTAGASYAYRAAAGSVFNDNGGNSFVAGGSGVWNVLGAWPFDNSANFGFSVAGCGTAGSLTGVGTGGTFTAGATSCAPVITTGIAATHGYVCSAWDLTTPADTLKPASSTTTTCTFGTATVVSGDKIQFTAVPF